MTPGLFIVVLYSSFSGNVFSSMEPEHSAVVESTEGFGVI